MNKHACIPRTQHCFSINGPSKELALYEHGDLCFSLYNLQEACSSQIFICEHSSMSDGDQTHHVTAHNWVLR